MTPSEQCLTVTGLEPRMSIHRNARFMKQQRAQCVIPSRTPLAIARRTAFQTDLVIHRLACKTAHFPEVDFGLGTIAKAAERL